MLVMVETISSYGKIVVTMETIAQHLLEDLDLISSPTKQKLGIPVNGRITSIWIQLAIDLMPATTQRQP